MNRQHRTRTMTKIFIQLSTLAGAALIMAACAAPRSGEDYMNPKYQPTSREQAAVETRGLFSKGGDEDGARSGFRLFSRRADPLAETAAEEPAESSTLKEDRAALAESSGAPYRLKAGDSIVLILRSIPQEQEYTDVIDEKGGVSLAYIGDIQAEGMTTSELEASIRKAYLDQKIYKNVTVTVLMQGKSYFLRGEVRAPGRYPLMSGVTVVQAIAAAGGFNEFAKHSNVQIIRGGRTFTVDVQDMESNPEMDLNIEAGDVIVVKRRWI